MNVDQKEQRDLEVLNTSLVRIAVVADDKLEKLLSNALPNLLSLLNSKSSAVQKKVIEILTHINHRLDACLNVKLPIEKLFIQYHSKATKNCIPLGTFSLIYIEKAFTRNTMSSKKLNKLVTLILVSISKCSPAQQLTRLHIFLKVLLQLVLAQGLDRQTCREQNKTRFSFLTRRDKKVLLRFLFNVMLLPDRSFSHRFPNVIPGLSGNQAREASRGGKLRLSPECLLQTKLMLVKFVSCGVFQEIDIIPILLAGCSDSSQSLVGYCESERRLVEEKCDFRLDSNKKCCYIESSEQMEETWLNFFFSLVGLYPSEPDSSDQRMLISPKLHKLLMPYFLRSNKVTSHPLTYSLIKYALRQLNQPRFRGASSNICEILEIQIAAMEILQNVLRDREFSKSEQFLERVPSYFRNICMAIQNPLLNSNMLHGAKRHRNMYSGAAEKLHDNVRMLLYAVSLKLITKKPEIFEDGDGARMFFTTLNKESIQIQKGVTDVMSDLQQTFEEARPSLPNTLRNIMFNMYYSTPGHLQPALGPLAQKFLQYLDHLVSRQPHRLAFMNGFHERLGEESPIRHSLADNKFCDVNALRMVWMYLERWKPTDFHYE